MKATIPTHDKDVIRRDLISQALFLARELLETDKTNLPEINALMALMCFHASRIDGRISSSGDLVLLKDQDRSMWHQEMIRTGQTYLARSSAGSRVSLYHFEALIAMEHCIATSYEKTKLEGHSKVL